MYPVSTRWSLSSACAYVYRLNILDTLDTKPRIISGSVMFRRVFLLASHIAGLFVALGTCVYVSSNRVNFLPNARNQSGFDECQANRGRETRLTPFIPLDFPIALFDVPLVTGAFVLSYSRFRRTIVDRRSTGSHVPIGTLRRCAIGTY